MHFRKKREREAKLKAAQEADGLCLGSGGPGPEPAPEKNLTTAEKLALIKAKINQGKEIDDNKLDQGTDDGRLKLNAHFFITMKI